MDEIGVSGGHAPDPRGETAASRHDADVDDYADYYASSDGSGLTRQQASAAVAGHQPGGGQRTPEGLVARPTRGMLLSAASSAAAAAPPWRASVAEGAWFGIPTTLEQAGPAWQGEALGFAAHTLHNRSPRSPPHCLCVSQGYPGLCTTALFLHGPETLCLPALLRSLSTPSRSTPCCGEPALPPGRRRRSGVAVPLHRARGPALLRF
jgi:hypothetical protein